MLSTSHKLVKGSVRRSAGRNHTQAVDGSPVVHVPAKTEPLPARGQACKAVAVSSVRGDENPKRSVASQRAHAAPQKLKTVTTDGTDVGMVPGGAASAAHAAGGAADQVPMPLLAGVLASADWQQIGSHPVTLSSSDGSGSEDERVMRAAAPPIHNQHRLAASSKVSAAQHARVVLARRKQQQGMQQQAESPVARFNNSTIKKRASSRTVSTAGSSDSTQALGQASRPMRRLAASNHMGGGQAKTSIKPAYNDATAGITTAQQSAARAARINASKVRSVLLLMSVLVLGVPLLTSVARTAAGVAQQRTMQPAGGVFSKLSMFSTSSRRAAPPAAAQASSSALLSNPVAAAGRRGLLLAAGAWSYMRQGLGWQQHSSYAAGAQRAAVAASAGSHAAGQLGSAGASSLGGSALHSVHTAGGTMLGHDRGSRLRAAAAASSDVGSLPAGSSGSGTEGGDVGGVPVLPPEQRTWRPDAAVRIMVITTDSDSSPYKAPWQAVMQHTGQRLEWTDPSFQLLQFTEQELQDSNSIEHFGKLLSQGCQVLLGTGITDSALTSKLAGKAAAGQLPAVRAFLGSDPLHPPSAELQQLTRLQGWAPQAPGPVASLMAQLMPWSKPAKAAVLWNTVNDLWARHSSEDLLFVFLVLINEYVTPVKEVRMTTKGFDLPSLYCMIKNCRQQISNCISNPTCKSALDCLQGCSFNDQVCQYRCIVSYETPELEAFSLCILQKHNCRSLDAQPPLRPDPKPMTTFNGKPLTHEIAEDLFVGWLRDIPGSSAATARGPDTAGTVTQGGTLPFSWLIAAGKNPAYDYFPCQHQLFYKGKAPGVVWYEPVFKVITLDGRQVWRRRRYRVRRGTTPGTFHFTVLDNGVTSKEYWRIMDCDQGLEWCLFYYSGAASVAGLSYSGAVLGTRDGTYPSSPEAAARITAALRAAGIEPWELSMAHNEGCADAPLSLAAAAV